MSISIAISDRLLPGTENRGDHLLLPAAGGGFSIDKIGKTGERYLNLTVTVQEEHSMAFEFRAYAAGEAEPRVTVRFGVLPRYRTNVPLDLSWLDGHILFPGHIPGQLKVVCHGSRIERKDVARAEIVSIPAYHDTRVLFEDAELSDSPRPAPVASGEKLIEYMKRVPLNLTATLDGAEGGLCRRGLRGDRRSDQL